MRLGLLRFVWNGLQSQLWLRNKDIERIFQPIANLTVRGVNADQSTAHRGHRRGWVIRRG